MPLVQNGTQKFPEWSPIKFGDMFEEIKQKTSDTEKYPLYSLTIENGVTEKTERYERSFLVTKNEDNYKIVPPNAFVYNPMNLRFGALAVNHTGKTVCVSQYYNVFKMKDESVLAFWENYLVMPSMLRFYFSIATGSLLEKLRVHYTDFVKIEKVLPSIEEQRQISLFLSLYDQKRQYQSKKVCAMEERKNGLLQQIFSQKIRFKADDGSEFEAWDELTIADLFTKVKGTNKDGVVTNVITNSAVEGLIPQRDFFEKDIAVEGNTDKYTIIHKGDFVYNPRKSTSAPYGPFNCYRLEEPGIVSPLYSCLKPVNEAFTPYLLYYFASPAWYSYIYHNGNQGGARHDRVGMTDDLLMGIPIGLPCIEEQKKISDFFALIDAQLKIEKDKLEAIKLVKKGLLQQMFV